MALGKSVQYDHVKLLLLNKGVYKDEKENDSIEDIKEVMFKEGIDCMPILNEAKEIVDVLFWADVFKETVTEVREKIDLPVVIMAGGKGTRLKPITNVIPKPLVPVGDKTILEVIMDQFEGIGLGDFDIIELPHLQRPARVKQHLRVHFG